MTACGRPLPARTQAKAVMTPARNAVPTKADLVRYDRATVDAIGRYEGASRPMRGKASTASPRDRATIVLSDGTKPHLESFDSERSERTASEIAQFNSKIVRVRRIAREVIPAQGESLLAPSIPDVVALQLEANSDTDCRRGSTL